MKTSIIERAAIIAASVDRLAHLNAEIATATAEAQAIKAEFIANGQDVYVGALHKATVVHTIRESLSPEKVKQLLTPEAYASCLNATPVHSVRVTGL